ncbi:MAG TPA: glycine zipper 2TM domain-containing protein [Rhizomicrobium sp.]|nr:glycine zipper 2TM domain-containing protein [Rhizomicrobium sp.]
MKRYLLAIAGLALLAPQMAAAQPGYDSNYDRRGDRQQYDSNRDYRPGAYQGRAYDNRYSDDRYAPGYARDYRDCHHDQGDRQATNAAIGAAAGGLLGNQVAGRGSRTGGTIAGVLLGAVAGYALTKDVDCNDRETAEPTYYRGLEGPVGRRYDWRSQQDRDYGNFTPTREYNRDNYTCRDWVSTTYREGRQMRRSGSACRYEDGNWYFQ